MQGKLSENEIFEHIGRKDVEIMVMARALEAQGKTLAEQAATIDDLKKQLKNVEPI